MLLFPRRCTGEERPRHPPLFVRFVAEATAWLAGARFDAASATVVAPAGRLILLRARPVSNPRGERTAMLTRRRAGPAFLPEMAGFY
jgi:hypothetical protein